MRAHARRPVMGAWAWWLAVATGCASGPPVATPVEVWVPRRDVAKSALDAPYLPGPGDPQVWVPRGDAAGEREDVEVWVPRSAAAVGGELPKVWVPRQDLQRRRRR